MVITLYYCPIALTRDKKITELDTMSSFARCSLVWEGGLGSKGAKTL